MENSLHESFDLKGWLERNCKVIIYCTLAVALLLFLFFSAPVNFPKGAIVNIGQGESLRSVSFKLQEQHIIRSRVAFEAFTILYGGEKHIIPADYLFEDRAPVFEVAHRIARGERHLSPIKVTIPEGFDLSDIAETLHLKLSAFDKDKFLSLAVGKEGYLFPDTYFFFTNATEEEVLTSLMENYEKKVTPIRPEILSSGKSEKQIIIMASLIERESKGDADRAIISGILWKRLSIGMPLQVDAAPETYKSKGLPEKPICNPGLEAILSAIHPQSSHYLYYLHDKEGNVHYASSFEEHKRNKIKYLP